MAERKKNCPQNFQVWVAFLMGMVIIVLALVVFDRVLGIGRPSEAPGNPKVAEAATLDPGDRPATYLNLTGSQTPAAWLGVEATDLSEESAQKLGLNIDGGAFVSSVLAGSPAATGGIRRGDIIVQLDHRDVEGLQDLVKALSHADPDDVVKVVVYRDSEREVLYVRLGQTSTSAATGSSAAVQQVAGELVPADQKWGLVVSALTQTLHSLYDIPKREQGVVIVMVIPGSAAARSGLKRGDLIKQVDRTEVESLADFFSALSSTSRHVLLQVYRDGSEVFVHVIAVSPMMPTAGKPEDAGESEDDEEEIKGYMGVPEQMPPMGKPGD